MRRLGAIGLTVLLTTCGGGEPATQITDRVCAGNAGIMGTFVDIPAGGFVKGGGALYSEELPEMRLRVEAFRLLAHEVTNAQFTAFVADTGYVTDAEQSAAAGGREAGSAVFRMPDETAGDWALIEGATWRAPGGPGTNIDDAATLPVVHVSHNDARAYANWAGGRLPSEVEWEYAASIGLPDPDDPVSGAYDAAGGPVANTWQGVFPVADSGGDGFRGAAPVGCYAANTLGLYDMIGNVWEWTDTPASGGAHTMKGGSYLCADNFCRRYRPAARQRQETDFSASHIGFRVAKDVVAD